jgi:predicted nuclease of predicted toxin-antitoxin system
VKFLLDESADFRLAAFLVARGHDVTAIAHDYPKSLVDPDVLAISVRERRTLITNDRDFGELIVRDGLPHLGVILLRLRSTALSVKLDRLAVVLDEFGDRLTEYLVVSEQSIRILERDSNTEDE